MSASHSAGQAHTIPRINNTIIFFKRNGHVVVDRNGVEYMYPVRVNDGAYHVVTVERRGNSMLVTLDNDQPVNLPMTSEFENCDLLIRIQ